MVPKDIILKIIEAGVMAPSGDNAQPWRFEVGHNYIDVFIPQAYYDERGVMAYDLFSVYIAHGALLENITIAADHFGYYADIKLFPQSDSVLFVAHIELREDAVDHQVDLYRCIAVRDTHREKYHRESITQVQRATLTAMKHPELPMAEVRLVEDPQGIRAISRAIATQVETVFSERQIHHFFFKNIRFSLGEVYETCDGLDVRTLMLDTHEKPLFRILQHWWVVKLLQPFGIHKITPFLESHRYQRTAAYCALVGSGATQVDAINQGRLMERLWLLGTRVELVMHPTFATFLLRDHTKPGAISPRTMKRLEDATRLIEQCFHCDEKYPDVLILFRVGRKLPTDRPLVRSLRKNPNITFL